MNACVTDFVAAVACSDGARVADFIRANSFDRPTLVLDTQVVARRYRALAAGLGRASILYAVKANPAREVIEALIAEGSHFDAASRGEIELCVALGAAPTTISFGNTVKRAAGHDQTLLNIGGRFPAYYGEDVDPPTIHARQVMQLVEGRFDAVRA